MLRIVVAVLFLVGASSTSGYAQEIEPFAEDIEEGNLGTYLQEIEQLTRDALEASRQAEEASSVAEVKEQADQVFRAVWGQPSGLLEGGARGAANVHGWRTRWQTDATEFDSTFVARYGSEPPDVQAPQQLGIMGRGRHVRKLLLLSLDDENASAMERLKTRRVLASLNNVIGWMKMDDGVTKGELQPRVDLTREWDSPSRFWNTTADTGWLLEAFSQALNILKTDYEGDVDVAREHAAGMTQLLERSLQGVDENDNGTIEPRKMEGGINLVLQEAQDAGWTAQADL